MLLVVVWYVLVALCVILLTVMSGVLKPEHRLPTDQELNLFTFVRIRESKSHHESADTSKDQVQKLIHDISRGKHQHSNNIVTINKQRYRLAYGIPIRDIQHEKKIVIYHGGYCQFGLDTAFCAFKSLLNKMKLIPDVLITVDCPADHWYNYRWFNFAGVVDQYSIIRTLELIHSGGNSDTNILLYGSSKGATNILQAINTMGKEMRPGFVDILSQIKGLVLECPTISFHKALNEVQCGKFTCWLAPRAMMSLDTKWTLNDLNYLPQDLPMLFASLPDDTISRKEDIDAIVQKLKERHCYKITRYVSNNRELVHGAIGKDEQFQTFALAFIEQLQFSSS